MFKKKQSYRATCSLDKETEETETKQLKREIETLKHENAELRETNIKLKQSLDELMRNTTSRRAPTVNSRPSTDSELQQQLNRTIQQLSETRQQLLNVQERLTVSEQVTAATQRREMLQEGVCQNLPSHNDYEELRFDLTEEHVYATIQLTTHRGYITLFIVTYYLLF